MIHTQSSLLHGTWYTNSYNWICLIILNYNLQNRLQFNWFTTIFIVNLLSLFFKKVHVSSFKLKILLKQQSETVKDQNIIFFFFFCCSFGMQFTLKGLLLGSWFLFFVGFLSKYCFISLYEKTEENLNFFNKKTRFFAKNILVKITTSKIILPSYRLIKSVMMSFFWMKRHSYYIIQLTLSLRDSW